MTFFFEKITQKHTLVLNLVLDLSASSINCKWKLNLINTHKTSLSHLIQCNNIFWHYTHFATMSNWSFVIGGDGGLLSFLQPDCLIWFDIDANAKNVHVYLFVFFTQFCLYLFVCLFVWGIFCSKFFFSPTTFGFQARVVDKTHSHLLACHCI